MRIKNRQVVKAHRLFQIVHIGHERVGQTFGPGEIIERSDRFSLPLNDYSNDAGGGRQEKQGDLFHDQGPDRTRLAVWPGTRRSAEPVQDSRPRGQ